MKYNTAHCFSANNLFDTFDKSKLKIKKEVVAKKYGFNKKQWICVSAFVYCCYLILLDIIENNATFVLPLFNGKRAFIHVKPFTGDEFKKARQNGAFSGIDILGSNFTGYRLVFSWEKGKHMKEKSIYINKRFKDMFYEHINNGKKYY